MKFKKNKFFYLIFLLSLLPALVIFRSSLMLHTHDGPVHLARMAAWFQAAEDNQWPPRWASGLDYGYGTPILIFTYPWPYFLSYLFLKAGLGLVFTYKLVLWLSFLFSGPLMFLAGRELLTDERKAFLVALFYQFHGFRLIEILIRGAFGEVWTYAFLPLALWGIAKIFKKDYRQGFFLTVLGTALLILTHNSISLVFFSALLFLTLLAAPNWSSRVIAWFAAGWGLMLASWYWLPALLERKYTYGDLFMKDLYLEHFPSLKQLFLPNFLNQAWGQVHDISVQVGLLPLLSLALAGWLVWQKKLALFEKRLAIFSWLLFLICLVLMQEISIPLWQRIPMLRQFQFSWRFLALVVLATSLAAVIAYNRPRSGATNPLRGRIGFYWLIVIAVFLTSLPFWRTLGFDEINEPDYWHYPLNTTYFGEADTIWAASPPAQYPKEYVEIVDGEGEIANLERSSTSHRFVLKNSTAVNVLDRTHFFPGWRVYVDGVEQAIQFQDQNYRGLITFRVSAGEHQIAVRFTRTKIHQISEMISLGALALLGLVFARKQKILASLDKG